MKIGSSTVDISPNKSKESRETELFHDGAKKPEHTSEKITGVFTMVNSCKSEKRVINLRTCKLFNW